MYELGQKIYFVKETCKSKTIRHKNWNEYKDRFKFKVVSAIIIKVTAEITDKGLRDYYTIDYSDISPYGIVQYCTSLKDNSESDLRCKCYNSIFETKKEAKKICDKLNRKHNK